MISAAHPSALSDLIEVISSAVVSVVVVGRGVTWETVKEMRGHRTGSS